MKRVYALTVAIIFVLALSVCLVNTTMAQKEPKGAEQIYQEFWGRGKATYEHGQALQKQADDLKIRGVQMCDEGQQMMDQAEKMKKK
jgi:hypothetical protein